METCSLSDFMQALKPWLNSDYIHKAVLDDQGNFRLLFVDGGEKVYCIDDCTAVQIKDVLELMKKNGVLVDA